MHRRVKLFLVVLGTSCSPAGRPTEHADRVSTAPDAATPERGAPASPVTAPSAAPAPPPPIACVPGPGVDYPVGPGQKYPSIGAVPMEKLGPGDTLRIFYRAAPYAEKIMIGALGGTAARPIRVCGVRGPNGELPILEGKDATTRKELSGFFPYDGHQVRGLVIVGHPHSAASYAATPSNVIIEGLEIRGASPPNGFTDASGKSLSYSSPAAGVFVERVNGLTIRGCSIHDNNNGVFAGTGGGAEGSRDVTLTGNHIWNNGGVSDPSEHNSYIEVNGSTYEYNWYGPTRKGNGAGIKDRGVVTAIRYNYFDDAGAHILDLVDAQEAKATSVPLADFHTTRVYGNVIVRAAASGSLIHYGGDSGNFQDYRKGTLRFYNNTVVVKNDTYKDWTRTAIFELSTMEETLWARNNVFFSTSAPTPMRPIGMMGARDQVTNGVASFGHDWVRDGMTASDLTPGASTVVHAVVTGLDSDAHGAEPGFVNMAGSDYTIAAAALGAPGSLAPEVPAAFWPTMQYVVHQSGKARPGLGAGALVQ